MATVHLVDNFGSDELPNYRFQYYLWVTESGSLSGSEDETGFRQNIWLKDGQYACPIGSSYDAPFAHECGWKHVIDFPSHHEIVEGPEFNGNRLWNHEFRTWWNSLPKVDSSDNELLGKDTLTKIAKKG